MVSERPQRADDVLNLILLEQADAGDSGCSRMQAGCGIVYGDTAESKDSDFRPAGFLQGGEASGRHSGGASFSEYRCEYGEVGFSGFDAQDIGGSVAGGGNQEVVSRRWLVGRDFQHTAHLMRHDIVCAQMDAVGSCGERDVGAGINEESSPQFRTSSQWSAVAHGREGVASQHFQFSHAQIFFAELDVVDSGTRGFGDFGEQGPAASAFVATKLASVGDVIEQTAVRHQLSAYYEDGQQPGITADR